MPSVNGRGSKTWVKLWLSGNARDQTHQREVNKSLPYQKPRQKQQQKQTKSFNNSKQPLHFSCSFYLILTNFHSRQSRHKNTSVGGKPPQGFFFLTELQPPPELFKSWITDAPSCPEAVRTTWRPRIQDWILFSNQCLQTFKRKGQLYVKHTFLQAEPASQEPAPPCLLVLGKFWRHLIQSVLALTLALIYLNWLDGPRRK